jgi:rfaE bifunctional protein nucleotidyltransferase chain/domain
MLRLSKVIPFNELDYVKAVCPSGLVATNGCFDVIHAGHVTYLEAARDLGSHLVVGINSDASVKELKGPSRPVNCAEDRALVVAALRCVSYVVIFDSVRATEFLKAIRPHVYVKGGDYTIETLNVEERTALEKMKTKIEFVPLLQGRSTTQILKACQAT